MNFSETIVVCNIKVGSCRQLNESMNFYECQRSRSFIDLGPSDSTFSNFFSFETAKLIEAKFHVEFPLDGEMKVSSNGLCHMTKMVTMPIYGKNL